MRKYLSVNLAGQQNYFIDACSDSHHINERNLTEVVCTIIADSCLNKVPLRDAPGTVKSEVWIHFDNIDGEKINKGRKEGRKWSNLEKAKKKKHAKENE